MSSIMADRLTARSDAPFVVLLIGMQVTKFFAFRTCLSVAQPLPRMLPHLHTHPEKACLNAKISFRYAPCNAEAKPGGDDYAVNEGGTPFLAGECSNVNATKGTGFIILLRPDVRPQATDNMRRGRVGAVNGQAPVGLIRAFWRNGPPENFV